MSRVKGGVATTRGRARMRKLTKGYQAGRRNLYRQAVVTHLRAGKFAFVHRRQKKRTFRRLWILRINAACRMRGLRYSEFIPALERANIEMDRKMLSEVAIHDPATFDMIVEIAKQHLSPAKQAA